MIDVNKMEKMLGVAVPVSSLKSKNSFGCGDFNDLKFLGSWAHQCNLNIIQLLPINDTGSDPSPYMALSSGALNPLYLNLFALPGAEEFEKALKADQKKLNKQNKVSYHTVREAKLQWAKQIFNGSNALKQQDSIERWVKKNSWVISYALFLHFKEENQGKDWPNWQAHNTITAKEINKLYKEINPFFYVWLQYYLDTQLFEVAQYLKELGVILKGDIPIMMNNDSVDVWQYPDLFDLKLVAGAPPDFFTIEGQRWGFPCYNWANHEKDNFAWWRSRLTRAERFFGAYRVDHILGFFRIWAINKKDNRAALGFFNPSVPLSVENLGQLGFDKTRIRWLSQPHIYLNEAKEKLGSYCDEILLKYFDRLGNQELFNFKKEIEGDAFLDQTDYPVEIKNALYSFYIDRMLIERPDGYYVAWWYLRSKAYASLNDTEKQAFNHFFQQTVAQSEQIWQEQALKLLSVLKESSSMLVCAEDLGAVPDCLPYVLTQLSMLGLKIVRWMRQDTGKEVVGHWLSLNDYPVLSVASLAVHDSSTLRGWWQEETDKQGLLEMMGLPLSILNEKELTVETALILVSCFVQQCASAIVILQLQDYLSLSEKYREANIDDERINIPGTVGNHNWSYRMLPSLETLCNDKAFSTLIRALKHWRLNEK